ncbi:hypothetical protein IV72_GL000145 [Atopobium minutum]|nr:hypothetical protein HMPREF1247_0350 [Atopobium sp. BV3Ac4]KRN56012.1 hypothetical protein IV72_GL000145 [Atopobium minutum]
MMNHFSLLSFVLRPLQLTYDLGFTHALSLLALIDTSAVGTVFHKLAVVYFDLMSIILQ